MEGVKFVFHGPAHHEGGTTLLLARAAAELSRQGQWVRVVDFADGALAGHLKRRGLRFEHTLPDPAGDAFAADELVVLILLHAKLLLRGGLRPQPGTRFLFWSTHPQDGFKLLPGFNLVRREDDRFRHWGGRLVHPRYWGRVRDFLEEGSRRSGLAWMDPQNSEANRRVFSLETPRTVLPVITEAVEPLAEVPAGREGLRRVAWVGRLEHFKTEAVRHVLHTLDLLARRTGGTVRFDVIGDGEDAGQLKAEAARCAAVQTVFHGRLPAEAVEQHLRHQTDLVLGHGLSILEGARLGLPSLVVDGYLLKLPSEQVQSRWLQDEPAGQVGWIVERQEEQRGPLLSALLAGWWPLQEQKALGAAARSHWVAHHTAAPVVARLRELASANDFTWERIQATGFHRLDLTGRAIEKAKRLRHALAAHRSS